MRYWGDSKCVRLGNNLWGGKGGGRLGGRTLQGRECRVKSLWPL